MTTYAYTGRDASGREVNGEMQAASASAVASELSGEGVTPVQICDTSNSSAGLSLSLGRGSVGLDELVMFCRQMRTLTKAGVPLIQALSGIADTSTNRCLREALRDVCVSLQGGRDLASSLERHPDIFSRLFVASVHVGESMGRLEEGFADLGDHLDREHDTIKKIKAAVRYPALVILAVAIAVTIINIWVVPAFSKVFATLDAELPLPTRILMGTSDFFVHQWPFLVLGVAAVVFGARHWVRTERGRYLWHRHRQRAPLVGPIIERATLARFARGFSLSLRSGVPILQGLQLVAMATDNAYLHERIESIRDRVGRGETLTSSAGASGLFTPLVLQMIAVGEESGSIDELLQEVAEYYEREVDHDLKRLSDAIEPVLVAVMGVIVLILALAVYLPLWDLAGAVRNQ